MNVSISSVLPSDINEALDVLVLAIKTHKATLSEYINFASDDLGIKINNDLLQKYNQPQLSKITSLQKYRKKKKVINIIDKIPFNLKPYAITSTIKRLLLSTESNDINEKMSILSQNGINVSINISEEKEAKSSKFMNSDWPHRIATFMTTQPISKVIPGKTVSVKYGIRANKYVRNFTVKECFDLFKKQFEDFDYGLTIFTQQIPKNVVSPTERDIIQNVCVTHSNINHEIKALNIFIQKKHLDKSLMLPTSTFELISNVICSDHKDFSKENVKSWKIECCNGECKKCGVEKFLSCYHQKLLEQISITDQSQISFLRGDMF